MFFLISYGLLNYATYYEAQASSPSFRPAFKWFDQRLSLCGALACLGVMLAIDLATGIVAVSILFAIFQYLKRKSDTARWADSRRAHHLQRVREHLLETRRFPGHHRDWRPQMLAFSHDPERRPRLLRLSGWLEGGSGLTTVVTLMEGLDLLLTRRKIETEKKLKQDIREYNPNAFSLVLTSGDLEVAVHALLQAHGIGPLRVNTVLLNWLDEKNLSGMGFRELLFSRQLKTLYGLGCNIAILSTDSEAWQRLADREPGPARIDIWWTDDATGNLMLLFAYLMTRSDLWADAELRVLVFPDHRDAAEQKTALQAVLDDARIHADIVSAPSRDKDGLASLSAESDLVFLPFRLRFNAMELPVDGEADDLLKALPVVVMVSAAEDIDLGAEPEEGIAAEMARAKDQQEKWMKRAKAAQDSAEQSLKDAASADARLKKEMSKPVDERDEDRIRQWTQERDAAAAKAETERRKAAKARSRVRDTQKEMPEETP